MTQENLHEPCPYAKKCGGCQLQNMDYERQLKWKQARCEILLKNFGRVGKIVGMDNPYHYRNKMQSAFARVSGGKVINGIYQSSTHKVLMVDHCMIEDKLSGEIASFIRKLVIKFGLYIYNEHNGTGFLRHVLIRRGFETGELMVVIVGADRMFPKKKDFVKAVLERYPQITTLVFNVNTTQTFLMLGEYEEVLHGKGYIEDVLCGCRFRISAKSFYQINPVQTEKLYQKAIDAAHLIADSRVMDAYCGIGTIGLVAAKTAGSVVGVELNADAVKDAKINAKINGAENAVFVCGEAGEVMQQLAAEGEKFDVVFMDPPRAGSNKKFIDALGVFSPKRIVYISCNPETLARDLPWIIQKGYRVESITPFDLFPHTNHCEVVVGLVKERANGTVRPMGYRKENKARRNERKK